MVRGGSVGGGGGGGGGGSGGWGGGGGSDQQNGHPTSLSAALAVLDSHNDYTSYSQDSLNRGRVRIGHTCQVLMATGFRKHTPV